MPRYHLNLRTGSELIRDKDREEFDGIESAKERALISAREIIADRLKSGRPIDGQIIEIANDDGNVELAIPVADAVV